MKFNNSERWEQYWVVRMIEYSALVESAPSQVISRAKEIAAGIKLPFLD